MVNVPPYAASLRWYGHWFASRLRGESDSEAIGNANRLCGVTGKEFARSLVGDQAAPVMLSVAVEGGASRLKRLGAEKSARVSLHGNWPHVHLGTLETLYGRAPYSQHLLPGLRRILGEEVRPEMRLGELNVLIHEWLSGFLPLPAGAMVGKDAEERADEQVVRRVVRRGEEVAAALCPELSVIDALMRYGPETSLALLI